MLQVSSSCSPGHTDATSEGDSTVADPIDLLILSKLASYMQPDFITILPEVEMDVRKKAPSSNLLCVASIKVEHIIYTLLLSITMPSADHFNIKI